MATPDKVFTQTYAWYKASVDRLLTASSIPAAQQPAVRQLIWQILGVLNASDRIPMVSRRGDWLLLGHRKSLKGNQPPSPPRCKTR